MMLALVGIMRKLKVFFGSHKHDWIVKIHQPTRDHMAKDVAAYIR